MASCSQADEGCSLIRGDVREYYGQRVKTSDDLIINCCTVDRETFSTEAKAAMKLIHPEVLSKNYGCGAVYPEAVEGCKVLDLGSGAGMDCFVLSKLVGPKGHVTGIDMTKEQLEVARKHIAYHAQVFGFSEPNVDFLEGFIERLQGVGIKEETFDVVVSNCVVNLSPDKEAVLKEAYRVLKVGGEMYFSDIYSNQPVPQSLKEDKVLWGECLSGALHWKDLMKMATEIGFAPPILFTSTLYRCDDPKLADMLGSSGCEGLQFCSATYRLMKVPWRKPNDEEREKEEALAEVRYKGTIASHKSGVKFSCQATLKVGCPVVMTASVSALLKACPRLSPHFDITPTTSLETTPITPPLAGFLDLNPFEMSSKSKSVGLAPSKSCDQSNGSGKSCDQSNGCSGSGTAPPKSCDQSSTEPPPAKKACCD